MAVKDKLTIEKPRIFDFTFLKLMRVSTFLSSLNAMFWFWLVLWGFSLLVVYGSGWIFDKVVPSTLPIEHDLLKDLILYGLAGLAVIYFLYLIYDAGLGEFLKEIGTWFLQLSEYHPVDIILLLGISLGFPFAYFIFLPLWIALGLFYGQIVLFVGLDLMIGYAHRMPKYKDVFHYMDLDDIINDVFEDSDSLDKDKMKIMIEHIYSEESYQEQVKRISVSILRR